MSENEKANTVNMDEYNKIVGAHNELKLKFEKAENELKVIKEQEQKDNIVNEQKKIWEQETTNLKNQISDMNKKIEEIAKKDNSVAAKGVINPQSNQSEEFSNKLDKVMPRIKHRFDKMPSPISRMRHYKSPVTKEFSKQDLGMALSLHATAQKVQPDIIPAEANKQADISIKRN